MPYCVRCGVELPPDAATCPLCDTPVILPPEVEVSASAGTCRTISPERPLFPYAEPSLKAHGLDKKRKGALELLLGSTIVAEVVLAFSLVPAPVGWFIPMVSVLFGAACVAVSLVLPFSYRWLATGWLILATVFIGILGGVLGGLFWPIVTCASLILFWICFVFPFFLSAKRRWISAVTQLISILGFLLLVDFLGDGRISWFYPVAFPIAGVFAVSMGILGLRMKFSNHENFPLADLVLSVCCIICMTVGAGDVFAFRYLTGQWAISWSKSLWVAVATIMVFLLLVSFSRRIRRYFNSQIKHS